MLITYERVYHTDRRAAEPTPELRREAERQSQFLLQTRTHVLTTHGGSLVRGPLVSSEGWIVTYTPAATS